MPLFNPEISARIAMYLYFNLLILRFSLKIFIVKDTSELSQFTICLWHLVG